MKRKASATFILVLLLLVLVFQFGFVAANFIAAYFPHDPHTIITVQYPENGMQFSVRTITIRFSLNLSLWYPDYLSEYNPSYSCNVSSIEYYLDGDLAGNLTEIAPAGKFINLSATLSGLADGKHSLEIKTTTNGRYWHQVGGFGHGDIPAWNDSSAPILDSSGLVNFTIDVTSLSVSVLSPVNTTYAISDVPLNFAVKEPISQIAYSLDGKEPFVIFGNTTLTGLANGDHNLTVYAKDDAGDVRVSETVFFSVGVAEPFQTVPVATVSAAAAIIVVAGLLVYFKKHKREVAYS